MQKEDLDKLVKDYTLTSREDVIEKALRRSMYKGMVIGFLSGVCVAVYMTIFCIRS